MTNEKEVLELEKFCAVVNYRGYYAAFPTKESLDAFAAAAFEEKMISEGWRQCAKGQGETQHCAQAVAYQAQIAIKDSALDKLARLGNEPHFGNSIGNMIAQEAISTTQQSSEAFLAEVRAKAKLEGKIEALTDAAGELMKRPDYVAPSLRASMVTVHVTSESNAELLLYMASELRASAAQPEGKT